MKKINDQEMPLLSLIQEIKSGTTNPKMLPVDLRQQIVETLTLEGYTNSQIAQLLTRSEKTVQRDLKEIRAKNALNPSVDLAKQVIGDLFMKARVHSAYLMRLARSKDGNISDKSQSEYLAWRVSKEFVEKLQSLGYAPLRPQEIVGDLFHHFNDENKEKSFAEVRDELNKVMEVAQECGTLTPELEQNVNNLNQKIEKAQIVHQVEKLSEQTTEQKEASDER